MKKADSRGNVVLGVTGSIAAHKAVDIASQLVKQGCAVRVVMTPDALRFLTPLPFKTLSRNPVITDLYDEEHGWKPSHILVADEADVLLVAPATAHTIAKLALGLAGDALSCLALALNPQAGLPATRQNVATLSARGARFIGPDTGLLSCGYEGIGRLLSVDRIVAETLATLAAGSGPTAAPSTAAKVRAGGRARGRS
jgi:phosphopantothenoylcysteine decarboxylase